MSRIWEIYGTLFHEKGENDDAVLTEYGKLNPHTHTLFAYKYANSNHIHRHIEKNTAPWYADKSPYQEFHDIFFNHDHWDAFEIGVLADDGTIILGTRVGSPHGPWFDDEGDQVMMPGWIRRLGNAEQADLPDGIFVNKATSSDYRLSYGRAYQIPQNFWAAAKDNGFLVGQLDNKYYIAF